MSTPSQETNKKKRRLEDVAQEDDRKPAARSSSVGTDAGASVSQKHEQVLRCLFSQLSSQRNASRERSNTNKGVGISSFADSLAKLQEDKDLIQKLQGSLNGLVNEIEDQRVKVHDSYSYFHIFLDGHVGLQDMILDFLDQDGFLALRDSSMLHIPLEKQLDRLAKFHDQSFPSSSVSVNLLSVNPSCMLHGTCPASPMISTSSEYCTCPSGERSIAYVANEEYPKLPRCPSWERSICYEAGHEFPKRSRW